MIGYVYQQWDMLLSAFKGGLSVNVDCFSVNDGGFISKRRGSSVNEGFISKRRVYQQKKGLSAKEGFISKRRVYQQ
ncbi:hypothetical protein, partial [Bacillus sp. FJAT-27245]|uniref:hypothetical protein n=1 Tax=Bacillus sp. FJAT-27245 TaxID=1684144 RepID=UPI001E36C6D7